MSRPSEALPEQTAAAEAAILINPEQESALRQALLQALDDRLAPDFSHLLTSGATREGDHLAQRKTKLAGAAYFDNTLIFIQNLNFELADILERQTVTLASNNRQLESGRYSLLNLFQKAQRALLKTQITETIEKIALSIKAWGLTTELLKLHNVHINNEQLTADVIARKLAANLIFYSTMTRSYFIFKSRSDIQKCLENTKEFLDKFSDNIPNLEKRKLVVEAGLMIERMIAILEIQHLDTTLPNAQTFRDLQENFIAILATIPVEPEAPLWDVSDSEQTSRATSAASSHYAEPQFATTAAYPPSIPEAGPATESPEIIVNEVMTSSLRLNALQNYLAENQEDPHTLPKLTAQACEISDEIKNSLNAFYNLVKLDALIPPTAASSLASHFLAITTLCLRNLQYYLHDPVQTLVDDQPHCEIQLQNIALLVKISEFIPLSPETQNEIASNLERIGDLQRPFKFPDTEIALADLSLWYNELETRNTAATAEPSQPLAARAPHSSVTAAAATFNDRSATRYV